MGQPPGSDDGRLEREKNMLNWAVIQTVYFSKFEKEREEIIARFDTLVLAEDFIKLALPEETRGRFRIEHLEN